MTGIFRDEIRHVDRRLAADRDQDVADDRQVQHFFQHDRADQARNLLIGSGFQRKHCGEIWRDRAVLELDRILEPRIKVFRLLGGTHRLNHPALELDHDWSLFWRAWNCSNTSLFPRVCNGSSVRGTGPGATRSGAGAAACTCVPFSGKPSAPGLSIHPRIMSRLASDRSRVTGMWFGSSMGSEKASRRIFKWRTTEP